MTSESFIKVCSAFLFTEQRFIYTAQCLILSFIHQCTMLKHIIQGIATFCYRRPKTSINDIISEHCIWPEAKVLHLLIEMHRILGANKIPARYICIDINEFNILMIFENARTIQIDECFHAASTGTTDTN